MFTFSAIRGQDFRNHLQHDLKQQEKYQYKIYEWKQNSGLKVFINNEH